MNRSSLRLSPYIALLIAIWTIALTARLYPDFRTAIRVQGRIVSVEEYIDDSCAAKLGPAADTCLAEARGDAALRLRREQARSILMILAPAVLYSAFLAISAAVRASVGGGTRTAKGS